MYQKTTGKKCKQCGGNLNFDPEHNCLVCEKCLLSVDFEKNRDYEKHTYNNNLDSTKDAMVFKCKYCGADIDLKIANISAVCPYCNSSFVIDNSKMEGLKPDFVIPFTFGKKKAAENFKAGIKRKWFLPNAFKKEPPMDVIEGIYFPSFAFDEQTSSYYNGVLERNETVRHGDRTTTITHTIPISGQNNMYHKDVFIESTNKLNQLQLNKILPYNTNLRFAYNEDFIRGYSVEYYTDRLSVCKQEADNMIDRIIRTSILSRYHYTRVRYLNISTTRSKEEFAYGILPTYKFTYNYNKKQYITFMNGQTGKVGGGLPKSKVKIVFFILGIVSFFAFFALIYLFNFFR